MPSTIGPDVARAAVALRRSHPHVSAREVLDLCLRQRTGPMVDFGAAIEPPEPFALLVAEAFDRGMTPDEWKAFTHAGVDPVLAAGARQVWRDVVLPNFAAAYGLV